MNKCDLEEVKHALCQEALSVPIEQWVEVGGRYSTKDGRFLLEDSHLLGTIYNQLKVRTSYREYEVIGTAYLSFYHRPTLSEEDKEFRERLRDEYRNSPSTIILSRIKEYREKLQNEAKCHRLTKALNAKTSLPENDEGIIDNRISNKLWWRFW